MLKKQNKKTISPTYLSLGFFILIASALTLAVSTHFKIPNLGEAPLKESSSAAEYPIYDTAISCNPDKSRDENGCKFYDKCTTEKLCRYDPNWPTNMTDNQSKEVYKTLYEEMGIKIPYFSDRVSAASQAINYSPMSCTYTPGGICFPKQYSRADVLHAIYPNLSKAQIGVLDTKMATVFNENGLENTYLIATFIGDIYTLPSLAIQLKSAIGNIFIKARSLLPDLAGVTTRSGAKLTFTKTATLKLVADVAEQEGASAIDLTARLPSIADEVVNISDDAGEVAIKVYSAESVLKSDVGLFKQVYEPMVLSLKNRIGFLPEGALNVKFTNEMVKIPGAVSNGLLESNGAYLASAHIPVTNVLTLAKGYGYAAEVSFHELLHVALRERSVNLAKYLYVDLKAALIKLGMSSDEAIDVVHAFEEGLVQTITNNNGAGRVIAYGEQVEMVEDLIGGQQNMPYIYDAIKTGNFDAFFKATNMNLNTLAAYLSEITLLSKNNVHNNVAYTSPLIFTPPTQSNLLSDIIKANYVSVSLGENDGPPVNLITKQTFNETSRTGKVLVNGLKTLTSRYNTVKLDEAGLRKMYLIATIAKEMNASSNRSFVLNTSDRNINALSFSNIKVKAVKLSDSSNTGHKASPIPSPSVSSSPRPTPTRTPSPTPSYTCPTKNGNLYGCLDSVFPNGLAEGWAVDQKSECSAIQVHFYVDKDLDPNYFVGAVAASIPRQDVNGHFKCDHGFQFSVPDSPPNLPTYKLRNGKVHTLYAHGIVLSGHGYNENLNGSPKQFTVTDNSAQPSATPQFVKVGGFIWDTNGQGVGGVPVAITKYYPPIGRDKTFSPTTAPNGNFSQGDFIVREDIYRVEPPPGLGAKTTTDQYSWNYNNNRNETAIGSPSYLGQKAGFWDCGSYYNKADQRCIFVVKKPFNLPGGALAKDVSTFIWGTRNASYQRYLRKSFLAFDGKTIYSTNCYFDANIFVPHDCASYTTSTITDIPTPVLGYDVTMDGNSTIKQHYVLSDGNTLVTRTCRWDNSKGTVIANTCGATSSIAINAPTKVSGLAVFSFYGKTRYSYISADGKNLHSTTCSYNTTTGCTPFTTTANGVPGGASGYGAFAYNYGSTNRIQQLFSTADGKNPAWRTCRTTSLTSIQCPSF